MNISTFFQPMTGLKLALLGLLFFFIIIILYGFYNGLVNSNLLKDIKSFFKTLFFVYKNSRLRVFWKDILFICIYICTGILSIFVFLGYYIGNKIRYIFIKD
jgi:hypothetical protein